VEVGGAWGWAAPHIEVDVWCGGVWRVVERVERYIAVGGVGSLLS